MALSLRVENSDDGPAISQVIRQAFGGEDEVRLVERLRDGGWTRLSLVATLDRQIVGHVLFSELPIVTDSRTVGALSLAPLAVLPAYQSQGIGSALTRRGLDMCREQGHRIVIVVGHPAYYPRFGFSAQLALRLDSPYSGESCMALELATGALNEIRGRVEYPPPFGEF